MNLTFFFAEEYESSLTNDTFHIRWKITYTLCRTLRKMVLILWNHLKKRTLLYLHFSQLCTSDLNNTIIYLINIQTQGQRSRAEPITRSLKHNSYQSKISLLYITPLISILHLYDKLALSDITFSLKLLRCLFSAIPRLIYYAGKIITVK
jgi:hypothetical protein